MHHPQQLVVWPTMSCFCLYICLSWSSPFYCTAKKPTPYANTSSIRKNDPKHTLKRSKKYSTFAHTTFGGEERFVLFLYFFHGFRNSPFCIKRKMPKIKLQTFWSKLRSTQTHLFTDANIMIITDTYLVDGNSQFNQLHPWSTSCPLFPIPSSLTCQRFSTPPQAPDFLRSIFHVLFRQYIHVHKRFLYILRVVMS